MKIIFSFLFVHNRDNYDLDQYQDEDEAVKKRIYKQAITINQSTLLSPKFQRIHEGVSRVFGLDDPPPGFGLIYPKYYYLGLYFMKHFKFFVKYFY